MCRAVWVVILFDDASCAACCQIKHQMLVTGVAGVVYAVASTSKLLYSVFIERSDKLNSYKEELDAISREFAWHSVLADEPAVPDALPNEWQPVWQSHLQLFTAARQYVQGHGCLPPVQTWKNGTQVYYNKTKGACG